MSKVVCPNCSKIFSIDDESGYQDILQQVRNNEFQRSLRQQLQLKEDSLEINN